MANEMDIFEKKLRDKRINWKWIFAHTALIWIFSYILGFIVGYSVSLGGAIYDVMDPRIELLIASVTLLTTFVITLIISLVQKINWRHLFLIIILLTITSLSNIIIMDAQFFDIILGGILIGISMVIAKILAILILKTYDTFKNKNQ